MIDDDKDLKLKIFVKEQIRKNLLKVGRKLVVEKGVDFLTARKLSEASNTSIGTIYNQFATMDNFILEQNMQTLDEMYGFMSIIIPALSALMLTGGEVTSSAVFGSVLSAVVTFLQAVCSAAVLPLISALMCISVTSKVCGEVDISGFYKLIKINRITLKKTRFIN